VLQVVGVRLSHASCLFNRLEVLFTSDELLFKSALGLDGGFKLCTQVLLKLTVRSREGVDLRLVALHRFSQGVVLALLKCVELGNKILNAGL